LQDKRVLHVSATAFGGGVSEILYTLIPLMADVGLHTEWHVIYGREERYNEMNARELTEGWDYCVVHDPQPAALRTLVPEKANSWVWRCHIDLSTPNRPTLDRLLPFLGGYDASLFHMRDYVPDAMDGKVHVVPPAIDPLAPKNMALSPEDASYVCHQFGIDVDRPLICQVSRFDPWKDPMGVIDAYRLVKERRPDTQLA